MSTVKDNKFKDQTFITIFIYFINSHLPNIKRQIVLQEKLFTYQYLYKCNPTQCIDHRLRYNSCPLCFVEKQQNILLKRKQIIKHKYYISFIFIFNSVNQLIFNYYFIILYLYYIIDL